MSRALVVLMVLISAAACSKSLDHPQAQIVDLTSSPAELLRDFDAHKTEARFVTVVAPS